MLTTKERIDTHSINIISFCRESADICYTLTD